ncbi:MAG: DNRLRE domain-containing protein [Bacteroidetes bacterium]|nr:DNRLRE domain-containing protein [Bacteroidota bacterium]
MAVMLLAFTQVFGQNIQTFIADYDAVIALTTSNNPTVQFTNYSTLDKNAAYRIWGPNPVEVHYNRSLMHFDFSSIAPGTYIESAKMDLFSYSANGGWPTHYVNVSESSLRRIDAQWDVNTVTWNNQPTVNPTFFPTILPAPTDPDQDYLGVDVTEIVRYMINNPTQNFGFLLRLENEQLDGALTFCSRDHANPSKWPRIHINFCKPDLEVVANRDAAIGTNPGMNTSGNNYVGAVQNAAYCMTSDDGTTNGHLNRALIGFDLSDLPTTTVINSAKLNLYALGATGVLPGHDGTANATEIRRVPVAWDQTQVTWDNQPSLGTLVTILPQSTSPTQDYLDIDVTQAVREMIAFPQNNHGFLLKLVTELEQNAMLFHSINSGDPSKAPKLVLDIDCSSIVGVEEKKVVDFALFPNPTTNSVHFRGTMDADGKVEFKIYDLSGRQLAIQDAGIINAGSHTLDISTLITDQPAGIYIVRAKFGEQVIDRKLVLTGN